MSRMVSASMLKHKKYAVFLSASALFLVVCWSYSNNFSSDFRQDAVRHFDAGETAQTTCPPPTPPAKDPDPILTDEERFEKMAIGETGTYVPDEDRLEKLNEEEEEMLLIEATSNLTSEESKPLYDAAGNEIGLRFLALSDWGGQTHPPYVTHTQMNVARAMQHFAATYDASFVLSLGDNFSPFGVRDVHDRRFQDTFEDAFAGPGLQRPWYIVAGNDDYKGNITAQLEYSKISQRWNFNKLNYLMSATLPTYKNISVDFVMIDTVQLCGRLPRNGGSVTPMGPDDVKLAEKTWTWIEKQLKDSSAEYLIVGGHYPVYSGGRHGSTLCLVERLQPLLERYQVSAYISGHDHSMQHIKAPGHGGVHYFVTGAANPTEDHAHHLDRVHRSTRYFWTNHLDRTKGAFLYCDVRRDAMKVDFVLSTNAVLYSTVVLPRSHPANRVPPPGPSHVTIPVVEHHQQKVKLELMDKNEAPWHLRVRPLQQQQLLLQRQRQQQQQQQLRYQQQRRAMYNKRFLQPKGRH